MRPWLFKKQHCSALRLTLTYKLMCRGVWQVVQRLPGKGGDRGGYSSGYSAGCDERQLQAGCKGRMLRHCQQGASGAQCAMFRPVRSVSARVDCAVE